MPDYHRLITPEVFYKFVADNINDLVAFYSPSGILEYVSPSLEQLLGYDAADALGRNIAEEFVHPEDVHLIALNNADLHKENKRSVLFEYRLLHKAGHWVHFESFRQPIFDESGAITGIMAICRDISQRKKAEQAIGVSEELYRRLADNILDLVVMLDPAGVHTYLSPSCMALLGYAPEELLGRHFADIVHPDDAVSLRVDILEKATKGQDTFLVEMRVKHKNGHFVFCETTIKALQSENGGITGFLATTRDITQWKLAQIAVIESEEKYRSLVESSDAMIAIVDERGSFIFVNDQQANFFAYPKEHIVGKTVYDFYDEKQAEIIYTIAKQVFAEMKRQVFEHEVTQQQKAFWLRSTLHPVFNSKGEVSAVMINTIDLTSIKLSEEALRKQNEVLKQIAFLQSHIVRSPLTNIQGILMLIDENAMSEENRYYFRLLKQAAGKLDEIVIEIVEKAIFIKRQTMAEL